VFSRDGLIMALLLLGAFLGLFFRWFGVQYLYSSEHMDDWGHAFVIPLISGYLVWQKRDEIWGAGKAVFWPGLAPFLLGVMSYFFCVVGVKNHMLQGFSIVLTLFGLVLLLLGPRVMRYIFLPVAFLAFGVTVSEIIMIKLTFPMQLIASQGAYVLLGVVGAVAGFSADVSGNVLTVITSGGKPIPLNVAEACSGMRTLVAFFALSAAVAVLGCRFWWQRVALFMTAAPVAILLNICRVAALGLVSLWNQSLATGQAHTLIGTLLLVPGLGLFMLVLWALNKVVEDVRPAGAAR
jgi:exosortase